MEDYAIEIIQYNKDTKIGVSKNGLCLYASSLSTNKSEIESVILNPGDSLNIYTGIGIDLPSYSQQK